MKKTLLLIVMLSVAVMAATAPFHVDAIRYRGKNIISGTFSFPTNFTVHRGDTFTIAVKGVAGTKLHVVSYLLPVKSQEQAATAMTATPIGKPFVVTISAAGTGSVVWKVNPQAKLGVHALRLVSPPQAAEPYKAAAGDNRWQWGSLFTVVP